MAKRKVLVYNEYEGIRKIIIRQLQTRDIIILETKSYDEAIKELNGTTIDLVITDNDIFNDKAYKLIENLRSTTSYLFTSIILLITGEKELYIEKYKPLNIACYLSKPFDITNFNSILDKILSTTKSKY